MRVSLALTVVAAAALAQVCLAESCAQDQVQCYGEPATGFNSSWLCCAPRWRCTWLNDGAPVCRQMNLDVGSSAHACRGREGTPASSVSIDCPEATSCAHVHGGWPVCTETGVREPSVPSTGLRGSPAAAPPSCATPHDHVCGGAPKTSYFQASTCCPASSKCGHLDDGSPVCLMRASSSSAADAQSVCCDGEPGSAGEGHTVCCGPRSTCGYLNDGFPLCREL